MGDAVTDSHRYEDGVGLQGDVVGACPNYEGVVKMRRPVSDRGSRSINFGDVSSDPISMTREVRNRVVAHRRNWGVDVVDSRCLNLYTNCRGKCRASVMAGCRRA